jgi:hypothetical protein
MSKPLRQITNYLEKQGEKPEFDLDSHTLFLTTPTEAGDVQTRYYYDLDMEVLSCQSIFAESFPRERAAALCQLLNRCNERLGFGAFVLLEEEDVVFEINHLLDREAQLSEAILDKLCFIPQEAMMEHLPAILAVGCEGADPEEAFELISNL